MKKSDSKKLEELSHKIDFLCNLIIKTRQYATTDPETVLMQARKSAEAICRQIFAAEIGEPGKIMLDELIKKLSQKKLLPQKIRLPLGTIQAYGNYAVHAQSEYETIDIESITPCLSALAQVTSWYFLEYLKIDVPPQIKEVEQETPREHPGRPKQAQTPKQQGAPEQTKTKQPSKRTQRAPVIHLRSEPLTVSDEEEAIKVFKLDEGLRPLKYIENDFEDQGEVILDHATGLMWQKSGSDTSMYYEDAQEYVQKLNEQKFAGYKDWRLPTIPELMSLLEPEEKNDDLYIDPIFDATQEYCWSADHYPEGSSGSAWLVDFPCGEVGWDGLSGGYARAVRSRKN